MMEFSNLDHQHQQDLHGGSSSLPSPPFPLVGGIYECNHNLMLNGGVFIPNVNGVLPSSRDFKLSNEIPPPPINTHMTQDLGFHWDRPAGYMNHPGNQQNSTPTEDFHLLSTNCIKSEKQGLQELDERLFLRALCQTNGLQPQPRDMLHDAQSFAGFGGRGTYSMVLPTTDVSRLNLPSPSLQSFSLGMDLQALDLLASARYGQSFSGPSFNTMSMLSDDIPFRHGPLQDPAQEASNNHFKISSLVSGVTEAKRTNSCMEHKESQLVLKRPRFETRSSCAPFKVRKEKLGDRIAALQQLVAPFGKTDTASVLMEAIGYIKFLQDQVETLSVPYLRSANNKKTRTTQEASSEDGDEFKPDLRSRGLCLVPLSCTSYVTNENGGVWSPPNYRGSD